MVPALQPLKESEFSSPFIVHWEAMWMVLAWACPLFEKLHKGTAQAFLSIWHTLAKPRLVHVSR
jgi:hypothetical protein